jgi:hypothetical protein
MGGLARLTTMGMGGKLANQTNTDMNPQPDLTKHSDRCNLKVSISDQSVIILRLPHLSERSVISKFLSTRWLLRFVALFSLLLVGAPAPAADYMLSDTSTSLPPGVIVLSPGNFSGGVLTLGVGDTITIDGTKPATIRFTGALTTGANNSINADGPASDLTILALGVVTLGPNTVLNANVTATAAVNIGIGSTLGGSITTISPTGVVTLAADSWVGGAILTDAGAVTVGNSSNVGGPISTQAGVVVLGANIEVLGGISTLAGGISIGAGSSTVGGGITTEAGVVTLTTDVKIEGGISTIAGGISIGAGSSTVGGGITTEAGVVTLTTNVKIDGDITTIAGAITIGANSSTCGSVISTGAGVITLSTDVKIGGSISTVAGAITVNAGSTVGGDIIPTGAGVVTLTGVLVGGKVTTGDGAITVNDSRVGGTVSSTGAGVVTVLNSTVEDSTLVVPTSPACVTPPPPAPGTVTLSNLTQTYTGFPLTPTATTVPAGLNVIWTGAPQINAGTYSVTATINDPNRQGTAPATGTFVINKAAATITLTDLVQPYTGSALTPTATTVPAGLNVIWTGAPQTNAGVYSVIATINDPNYEGSFACSFVITKALSPVTLTDLVQPYTGSALTPTATTVPTGLSVIWTGAPQTDAGVYPVIATINDPNYQGTAIGTFVISGTTNPATVTLSELVQTYTGSALTPTATTVPAGLNVIWTGAPQTNAGVYSVIATIVDTNYQGTASGTFVINKAPATVTLSELTKNYTGAFLTPIAMTTPDGLPIIRTNLPQIDVGEYSVNATINHQNYQGTACGTFTISAVPGVVPPPNE